MKFKVSFLLLFPSILAWSQQRNHWADSVILKMALHEKIGQLFMIPVSTYLSREEQAEFSRIIKKYHPGGLYITKGSPESHKRLIGNLQKTSKIPMLVGLNAEWGLGQTLDSVLTFPKPMVLGAITEDSLVYQTGVSIGKQMKAIGAHINFGPNLDIDVPKTGSTIAYRYFGDDKVRTTEKAMSFVRGLQSQQVMAVVKHLPGVVGMEEREIFNTIINLDSFDTLSFYPFQKLLAEGVKGINTAYLHFATIKNKKPVPAPLSQIFISGLLKERLKYDGLIFTEISFLKTLVRKRKGEIEKLAFNLGNDIMIGPSNIEMAIRKISKAVKKDKKLMEQLNTSVKKILMAKYDVGLAGSNDSIHGEFDLTRVETSTIRQEIIESAATVISNTNNLLPIQNLLNRRFYFISMGNNDGNFLRYLNRYAQFEPITIAKLTDTIQVNKVNSSDIVVVGFFGNSLIIPAKAGRWLNEFSRKNNLIFCHFGNPYDLRYFKNLPVIMEGYSEEDLATILPQVIFGALPARGVLPVSDSSFSSKNIKTNILNRLGYSWPELVGMDSNMLTQIDKLAGEAIESGATPGCRVLIARKGKVIFDKSYGWHSYDKKIPVTENSIYDLASVTKISATLQTTMFLFEKGMIDLDKKASVYLPELKTSNKRDFTIRDILTHQSGLWPFLPFWLKTMKDSVFIPGYFDKSKSFDYPLPVSENLFAHWSLKDSLWNWIINSKVQEKKDRRPFEFKYSDMGFYILQHLSEKLFEQPIEKVLSKNLYGPLGSYTTGYLPLKRFTSAQIAPTENDRSFRRSHLTGYVHDQGAAMHGGIAGHAGLFSSANDLAKLAQMWLQRGSYGGVQFFKPSTIDLFSSRQFETNHRGLGWDKPGVFNPNGSTSVNASGKTFGHTGFTGTCIWVDPEYELVYIFLSNRVNPDMNNSKLLDANIRPRIHDIAYRSIFKFQKR